MPSGGEQRDSGPSRGGEAAKAVDDRLPRRGKFKYISWELGGKRDRNVLYAYLYMHVYIYTAYVHMLSIAEHNRRWIDVDSIDRYCRFFNSQIIDPLVEVFFYF